MAVPLLTLVLLGRTSWALYAAFGAFAALYGRSQIHLPRAVMQSSAGVALVVLVVAGACLAALDAGEWAVVVGATVIAAAGGATSTSFGWQPAGPLFLVFGFGTVSAAPGTWSDVPIALSVSAASAAFAVLVGNVGAVVRGTKSARPALRSPWTVDPLRYAVVVVVAGIIATSAGVGHPYWAMVAAIAPLTVRGLDHQALRAAHRILGTAIGLVLAALLLLPELDPVAVVLVVVVLQIATELFVLRNYGLALLFITPMALLMSRLGTSRPTGELLFDRGVQTVIGGLVAVALLVVEHRVLRESSTGSGDRGRTARD